MTSNAVDTPQSFESNATQRLAAVSTRLAAVSARLQAVALPQSKPKSSESGHGWRLPFSLNEVVAFMLAASAVCAVKLGLLEWLTW